MLNKALAFDDVLLTPRKCVVESRNNISLKQKFLGLPFKIPIISANMSTVTELKMVDVMHTEGGLGILHRMMPLKEQLSLIEKLHISKYTVGASIEGSLDGLKNAKALIAAGANIICLEVAHAHSQKVIEVSAEFIQKYPKIPLIIGNVATASAVEDFRQFHFKKGYDELYWGKYVAFKVGVGSGSQCTTRIVTGCGIPTLQSLMDIKSWHEDVNLIADGGIKNSGDVVKCLAAGANMVMVGSLLAGTLEAPGNVIKHNGALYKIYRGSASYGQKFELNKGIEFVEGAKTLVPYKGSAEDILQTLSDGIRSGISYLGCNSLEDMLYCRQSIVFVEISNSGYTESTAHGARTEIMNDLELVYEKLTKLLEAQRCFLSVVKKETIIRGKYYDEAFESACRINNDISYIFGLTPDSIQTLEKTSKQLALSALELERMYSLNSPE